VVKAIKIMLFIGFTFQNIAKNYGDKLYDDEISDFVHAIKQNYFLSTASLLVTLSQK